MSIQALPAEFTLINSVYLPEMVEWALGFEYGETIDSNAVMESGSNTFSVTLYYEDGTERTSYLDYAIVDDVTYRIVREEQPACWSEIWYTEESMPTEPLETVPPDDAPPLNLPEHFTKELDDNKVCIAVLPTGIAVDFVGYRYIIPEEQDILREYYTAANATAHQYTQWDSGNRRAGWWIVYQGATRS